VARRRYRLVLGAVGALCLAVAVVVVVVVHSRGQSHTAAETVPPSAGRSDSAPASSAPAVVAQPLNPAAHNCAASPSSCGYPDASNTGIPSGTVLKKSGCISKTSPGQVIQNITLSGCGINVTSADVVIRNVKISMASPDSFAIMIRDGASATIDHADISGLDESGKSLQYAVLS
jgi:hypothetical protein